MTQPLNGKKVLVLAASGVDESAMVTVQRHLAQAGAVASTVGVEPGLLNSWNGSTFGLYFPVDVQINLALGADFDALVVPPGSRSIQKLMANPHAERIISSFVAAEKPMCFLGDARALLDKCGHGAAPVLTDLAELGARPALMQEAA